MILRFETELFGDMEKHQVWTDEETLNEGQEIQLVNSNCEFNFDNVTGQFENEDLMYCFICDLEIIDTYLDEYIPDKSNNGGCYAFATAKVLKIYEKTY